MLSGTFALLPSVSGLLEEKEMDFNKGSCDAVVEVV
jgi:hypothetical protein